MKNKDQERKKDILQKLWKTIEMIAVLKPEEFYYNLFVQEMTVDDKTQEVCGTVCCVAGWYPKYIPEAKIIWSSKEHVVVRGLSKDPLAVGKQLALYHNLSNEFIQYMFLGESLILHLTPLGVTMFDEAMEANGFSHLIFSGIREQQETTRKIRHIKKTAFENYPIVTLPMVQSGFELLYYLIENDYIIY